MRNKPRQRIDPKAVSYWRWSASIKTGFFLLIPTGYQLVRQHWQWPAWISYALLGLVLSYAVYAIFIRPSVTWRTWRYEVTEQEIDLLHGVFVKTRTLIPMVRVQHVDTEQGPLLRRFGLSSVNISTAAGSHEIPALDDKVAERLRDQISVLARVVDEDV